MGGGIPLGEAEETEAPKRLPLSSCAASRQEVNTKVEASDMRHVIVHMTQKS